MKVINYKLLFFILFLGLLSCNKDTDPINNNGNNGPGNGNGTNTDLWSIPFEEVRDGGPGKDGIPSVDNPQFTTVENINYMEEDDLIIGYRIGGELRGYPHPILDWHEIVNDGNGSHNTAITYCPLTGTAIAWDRKVNGKLTAFGVSGLLYNSNLIPYDRASDSNWSQMLMKGVNGQEINTVIKTSSVVETSWKTWKKMFPDSKVMTTSTGFNRSYGNYPYRDYKTSKALIFGVDKEDDRLHKKERVLGVIIDGEVKAYRFDSFNSEKVNVVNDIYKGVNIVIIGSQQDNYLTVFNRKLNDGTVLEMTAVQNEGNIVMQDNLGNKYNVLGEKVEGATNSKTVLTAPTAYIGYWFSWGAFYPDAEIYEN